MCTSWIFALLAIGVQCTFGEPDERIVGGYQINIKQAPWNAQIRYDKWHFCGGTIISDEWILTAAHCLGDPSKLSVIVGETKTSNGGFGLQIDKVITHPDFKPNAEDFDFGLIKMKRKLEFCDKVGSIKLAPANDTQTFGRTGTVTGWGITHNPCDSAGTLREVKVPIVCQRQCCSAYAKINRTITASMLCAGYLKDGGQDACGGDSGGPLFIYDQNQENPTVFGIVSWGYECAEPRFPGVYARVSTAREWIAENTGI